MWERVYQAWKGKGVEFLGLGLNDTKAAAAAFVRRHGLTFPNAYDHDGRVARLYGFSYQPYWAVVSKGGALLRTGYGPSGEAELVATIRSLTGAK